MEDIIYGPINLLGHGPFSLSPDDIKNIEEKYKKLKTDRKKKSDYNLNLMLLVGHNN